MSKSHTSIREANVELLRILAAYFVVMIHVSSTLSGTTVAYNAFARFSVPIFVIISGRFLLSKERSFSSVIKKSSRLLAMMVVWSALYYLFFTLWAAKPNLVFWRYLLTEPVHLWYLWAAAALYLMTPVLYVFCSNASKTVYQYALASTFLLGSVLFILLRADNSPLLADIADQAKLPYQLGFVFCFLLGDYTARFPLKKPAVTGWILFLSASLVSVGMNLWLARTNGSDLLLSFFAPANLISAVGLYWVFQKVSLADRWVPLIHGWSACTLGIYLIHPMLLYLLSPLRATLELPPLWEVPLFTLLIFGLASLLVLLWRKLRSLVFLT